MAISQQEFDTILNDETKQIDENIAWGKDEDHSPALDSGPTSRRKPVILCLWLIVTTLPRVRFHTPSSIETRDAYMLLTSARTTTTRNAT